MGFSEEIDFFGSKGRGVGVGVFFLLLGFLVMGFFFRILWVILRIRLGFGFFGNLGLVIGMFFVFCGGECGVSFFLEVILSLFLV